MRFTTVLKKFLKYKDKKMIFIEDLNSSKEHGYIIHNLSKENEKEGIKICRYRKKSNNILNDINILDYFYTFIDNDTFYNQISEIRIESSIYRDIVYNIGKYSYTDSNVYFEKGNKLSYLRLANFYNSIYINILKIILKNGYNANAEINQRKSKTSFIVYLNGGYTLADITELYFTEKSIIKSYFECPHDIIRYRKEYDKASFNTFLNAADLSYNPYTDINSKPIYRLCNKQVLIGHDGLYFKNINPLTNENKFINISDNENIQNKIYDLEFNKLIKKGTKQK